MPVLACQPVRRAAAIRRCSRSSTRLHPVAVEVARADPGQHALDEEDLAGPEGADPGEHPLVEQGVADEPLGCRDPLGRDGGVPVGPEHVGAEVADQVGLAGGRDEVEHAQPQAERRPPAGEHRGPQVVAAQRALGGRARVLDAPLALHPQVGVQGAAGVEAVQQVLAAGDDLEGA